MTIWQDTAGVFIGEFEVMSLTFERQTRKVVVTATEISSSEIVVLGLPIALGVTVAARTIEMFEDPQPVKKKLVRKKKPVRKKQPKC